MKEKNKEEDKDKDKDKGDEVSREIPELVVTDEILNDFSLLWYDPNVNNVENKKYQERFKNLFKEVVAFETYQESQIKDSIEKATMPIVFISCGKDYEKVKDIAEGNSLIVAIFIFCADVKEYAGLKNNNKVLGIISNFTNLADSLKHVHADIASHFQRFFETREEQTFYDLNDKNKIIRSLTIACTGDQFSVFFPLGTKKLNFEDYLTQNVFDGIRAAASGDQKIKSSERKVREVLKYLSGHKKPEEIIKSYTMERLYFMLNLYLRFGNARGFRLFKEYMFCLKASICEKGKPVVEKGTKVFRGLSLKDDFIKKYEERKGSIVLLNAFTSTTLNLQKALKFASSNSSGKAVLIEMVFVDFDKAFAEYIMDFGFPEENGVFFPADISGCSVYPGEKEVLFPPFYPIRIVNVCEENLNGKTYRKIYAETPKSVSVAGKDFIKNLFKGVTDNIAYTIAYIESLFDLIKKKAVDKLSISNLVQKCISTAQHSRKCGDPRADY